MSPTSSVKFFTSVLLIAGFCQSAAEPPAEPMSVWFTAPARSYHESCPLGNGRLGAMDLGGVDTCQIVLNESSVWSGGPYDANRPDAYKCLPEAREALFSENHDAAKALLGANFRYPEGVRGWDDENQFGCYQTLGDLMLKFKLGGEGVVVTSPSGHGTGNLLGAMREVRYDVAPASVIGITGDHSISGTFDGKAQTKWCVENPGAAVVWLAELHAPTKVSSYTLTSADDVPTRDPKEWSLEGSNDGRQWTALDKQAMPEPFANRFEEKHFQVTALGDYRFYRITFIPRDPFFQIGEIRLAGVDLTGNARAPADYRRDLNLMRGVSTTQFSVGGVKFQRELIVSKPDEVIAMRIRSSTKGGVSLSAALSRKQNATFRADDNLHVMQGQLPFNKPGGGGEGVKFIGLLGVTAVGGKTTATDQFTQDKEFLRKYYPLLRGASEFCAAVLVEDPRTKALVTVPSSSPENAFAFTAPDGSRKTGHFCAGSTYDMQIIRGLFKATTAAARILETDEDFAKSIEAASARLAPTKLNSAGRIMEWQEDYEETEINHRHVSHLWGLFPGDEISANTPELLEGARKSLDRRGDDSVGWSMAWKDGKVTQHRITSPQTRNVKVKINGAVQTSTTTSQ